jgi:hypothetical protein
MTERVEQRYYIKFCQKLGDNQSETICKIQQAFGNDAMGVTQIKEWYTRCKMAELQLTVTSVPVGRQQAKIQMPLTKCTV